MVRVPLTLPDVAGVKVTLIMQLDPSTRVPEQLSFSANSALATMPEMFSVAVPQLFSVIVCAALVLAMIWLEKINVLAERLAFTPEVSPTPSTECGLPCVLSFTVKAALRGPSCPGVKAKLMVQFAPPSRVDPQELV